MKKRFSISLEESLVQLLKRMANEQGRSLSGMIEFLLRKAVEDSKS